MADEPAKPAKRAAAKKPAAKKAPAKPVTATEAVTPAKRTPAKKAAAPAKRTAARKAAPAPAQPAESAQPAAPTPPPRIAAYVDRYVTGAPEVIGEAEERHPREPVATPPPRNPGLVEDLVDGLLGDAEVHRDSPLLVRVVRGRWVPALVAGLPAVAVALVAVVAFTGGLLVAEQPGSDEPLVEDLTFGRWIRSVFMAVAMAFGSPLSSVARADESSQATVITAVPLVVTLLTLAAVWIMARRVLPEDDDPLPAAVRTAFVFAAGIAAVAAFGRYEEGGTEVEQFFEEPEIGVTTVSVAPFKAMFWAFLAALAVAYLARRSFRLPLAVRGAIAGVTTGIGVSFVAMVGLAYAYAGRVDANAADVTLVLPSAVAAGLNLGTAGLAVAMGGPVSVPFDNVEVSLWESWVPGGYVVLLAIPVIAVAAGVGYVLRYGRVDAREAARACQSMAVPAALFWWLLAIAGSVAYRLDVFFVVGNLRAGAVLWSALLVLLWFGVLGWLGGHLVLRRANLSGATDRWSPPPGAAEGPDSSGDPRR